MADPLVVLKHRDPGVLHYKAYKALPSPRDNEIYFVFKFQHLGHDFPVGNRDDLGSIGRKTASGKGIRHQPGDGQVGSYRFRTAAEDHAIARFNAEPRGIGRHPGS